MDRLRFLKLALTHIHGPDIAEHLASAHRGSTIRQAQSVWKKFQSWLPVEATNITRDTVLRFLIHLASDLGLNTRTVVNYRGALALPLKTAFLIDFNHESFNLLTRSQFIENPPQPKKIPSWSLDVVLEALSTQRFSLELITPKDLLLKTLFLVALASGNRCSELAATRRGGITMVNGQVTLPVDPVFLFKNQALARPNPPPITFPTLGFENILCPWSFLQRYLATTTPARNEDSIFLHPTTSVPLKAGRVSYWLTQAIKTADNTATAATGHDIRKMAHSLAFARGVSVDDIVKHAFWHSPHVFIRKYLCQVSSASRKVVAGRST